MDCKSAAFGHAWFDPRNLHQIKEMWQSPVYCNSLENCRVERHREFESHRFRQSCLLSSYTGTPKNLPMSTKARTGQEELGYRGFKRHSEHLLCIASSIGRALVSKTRGWEFEALAVRQVSTDWWRSWLAHMPVTHGVAGSSPVQSANVFKMRLW